MTRAKRLDMIQREVKSLVEAEALYLYRLARKAEEHHCSSALVERLMREAEALRTSFMAAPEQCLNDVLRDQFEHAFRSEL